jgi:hypothetical protein
MRSVRQDLGTKSDDEVADWMAGVGPGSPNEMTARAEFLRRQTALQREATQAARDTATYTQRSARYMLWSVIVLAISSLTICCRRGCSSGHWHLTRPRHTARPYRGYGAWAYAQSLVFLHRRTPTTWPIAANFAVSWRPLGSSPGWGSRRR